MEYYSESCFAKNHGLARALDSVTEIPDFSHISMEAYLENLHVFFYHKEKQLVAGTVFIDVIMAG